jgi:hypothetical protein
MNLVPYVPLFAKVPPEKASAILSFIAALEKLGGDLPTILAFVEANLPAILALIAAFK